jgi:ribosomal protein L23
MMILSASENDSTFAVRDTAKGTKHQTIRGAIKQLFRSAVKAITSCGEEDPAPRRRRRGETEKGFRHAAPVVVDPAVRSRDGEIAAAYLFDFHDWMLQHGDNMNEAAELDEGFGIEQSHFHLRF